MQDISALTLFDVGLLQGAEQTKTCRDCGKTLPASDFYMKRPETGERQSFCKTCNNERSVAWRDNNRARSNARQREFARKNPDKIMRIDLRRRAKEYGLDPDEVMAHFDAHCGLCDICGQTPESRDPTFKAKRLCIDHDHETGHFRGLICRNCNLAIGNMRDNPKWLIEAANYLERHTLP